jgi:hypothetical protein
VWSGVIVGSHPGLYGLTSLGGGVAGAGVGPFALKRSALPLVHGEYGRVPDMLNPELGQVMTEVMASVGRTVVGHDPLDGDTVTGQPVERAAEESKGAHFFSSGRSSV